jgi:hypothetical protein
VYVLKDGQAVPTAIRIGITDGANTEVVDGLSEGDEIITDSSDAARGGAQGGQGGLRRLF